MSTDATRDKVFWTHEVQRRDVALRVAMQDGAPDERVAELRAARTEADRELARYAAPRPATGTPGD